MNKYQIVAGPGPEELSLTRQVTYEDEERLENLESDVAVVVFPPKLYLICVEDGGNYSQVLLFVIVSISMLGMELPQILPFDTQGISMLGTFYILDGD